MAVLLDQPCGVVAGDEGADGVAQGFFFDEGDQIHSFPRIDLVVHINGEGGWVELDDGGLGVQDERTIGGGE